MFLKKHMAHFFANFEPGIDIFYCCKPSKQNR